MNYKKNDDNYYYGRQSAAHCRRGVEAPRQHNDRRSRVAVPGR